MTVGKRKIRWVGLFSGESGWRYACVLGICNTHLCTHSCFCLRIQGDQLFGEQQRLL